MEGEEERRADQQSFTTALFLISVPLWQKDPALPVIEIPDTAPQLWN